MVNETIKITDKKLIQRQLWQLGRKVQDVSNLPGVNYDLLVDEIVRVSILGVDRMYKGGCDVIAGFIEGKKRYAINREKSEKELFANKRFLEKLEWKTPTEIFRKEK